jgi:hypothetical protein
VATDLTRIGEKARKEPGLVFTSLYHHICDVDNLRACYDRLEADKATGEDGVTKGEYGKKLEENLRELSERLKRMGYRPGPKRRTYIPKPGSEKGRPLGISWRTRLLRKRPNGRWSRSTRPYSRTAAMPIDPGTANTNVWMSWAGRFSGGMSTT